MRPPKLVRFAIAQAPAARETIHRLLRRRGVSRRVYMSTAVRRLLIIACVASVFSLSAQTTKKTTTTTPATVTTDPAQANVDIPKSDQAMTAPVSADTDKDASDARAMRLTLDGAVHTALERNIGLQLQRYDLGMAGAQLQGAYFVFDPIAGATLNHSSTQNPVTSSFQSSGGTSTDANVSLRDTIPTGGVL